MRRALLACLLLASACSFEHGHLGGDGGVASGDGDAPPLPVGHTRLIDITDGEVIDGPHADFPLLVALDESWLRDTAHGGDVKSSAGFDILFSSDAAGAMPLAHEVNRYAPDTGRLIAWVKLPMLATTTTLYIHYGDPAITSSREDAPAVWSGGFAGVWHLESDLIDDVSATPGTNGGSTNGTGKCGAGRTFDGAASYIDVAATVRIDDVFTGGGTAEAWVNANTFGENSRGRIFDKGDAGGVTTNGWLLAVDTFNVNSSILFSFGASTQAGEWNSPAASFATGGWTHLAVTFNRDSIANDPKLYINGHEVVANENFAFSGTPGGDTGLALRLGNRIAGDRTFDGTIDEPRLATVMRSAGWIETTYRNENNPTGFYTVGPELSAR